MKIDPKRFATFFEVAKSSGDASAVSKLGDAASAFRALDSDGDGALTEVDRPSSTTASLALLETARAAHKKGDTSFAETGYAIGLSKFTSAQANNPTAVTQALWNMVQIKEQKGEFDIALSLVQRLCFNAAGAPTNDAAAHIMRAEIYIDKFHKLVGRTDAGEFVSTGPLTVDITEGTHFRVRASAIGMLDKAHAAYADAEAAAKRSTPAQGLSQAQLDEALGTGLGLLSAERQRYTFLLALGVQQELTGNAIVVPNDPKFVLAAQEMVRTIRTQAEPLFFKAFREDPTNAALSDAQLHALAQRVVTKMWLTWTNAPTVAERE